MKLREPGGPLAEWNRALNRDHPPDLFERHPNPLLRFVEGRRRARLRALAERVLPSGDSAVVVADLGCGGGFAGRSLRDVVARRGGRIVFADIDPAMLGAIAGSSVCDRRDIKDGAGESFVVSDVTRLPFRDGSLDAAIASAVLEHLPDPGAALAAMARAVRRGTGRVRVNVPNDRVVLAAKRAVRAARLSRLFGGMTPGLAPGHLHVFGAGELRALCAAAGEVETFLYDPFAFSWFAVIRPR